MTADIAFGSLVIRQGILEGDKNNSIIDGLFTSPQSFYCVSCPDLNMLEPSNNPKLTRGILECN
jgi:hypothetical protein